MIIIIALLCLCKAYGQTKPLKPVVLIPGVLATLLEGEVNIPDDAKIPLPSYCSRKQKYGRMWINLDNLNPYRSECSVGYLK